MIHDKDKFVWAIIFFSVAMILNFPFPHRYPLGELILMKLKLPTQSSSGFIYMGIIVLILIIVALTLLVRSLSKYRIRLSLLAFILVSFIPSMIVNTYQSTFAKGIYAIFYEIESSECDFELMDEYKLHGQCYLYFENKSKDDVTFSLEFIEDESFENEPAFVSLMNEKGDHKITLSPREHKRIKFEEVIDVSNMEEYIEQGSAYYINIIIKEKNKRRNL